MSEKRAAAQRSRLYSPLAVIALAVASLLALLIAGFGSRLGLWHFRTGFLVIRVSAYVGLAVALAALFMMYYYARKREAARTLLSFVALAAAAVAVGFPVSWAMRAKSVPRIHDITTDLNSPPPFVAVAPKRPGRVAYAGAEVAAEQLKAYPDLKTLVLSLPADQAFARAQDTAREMGWEIDAAVPAEGRIEATDTTFWFGFQDDISVRITPAGNRSLVDVRSASRVGISDVGTNAARIRKFLQRLTQYSPGK